MKPHEGITFNWETQSPVHIGTGMSRIGGADRLIRIEGDEAWIPGDAVKGAIRGSAERLVRWLGLDIPDAGARDSTPRAWVVRRLFAPELAGSSRFVQFLAAKATVPRGRGKTEIASTAIDETTGAAREKTLRVIETLRRNVIFKGRIRLYGDWSGEQAAADLTFLHAALAATETVGGKRAAGFGAVRATIEGAAPALGDPATIAAIRRHVIESGVVE